MVRGKSVELFALDAGRIGTVGLFRGEAWVILAVSKVRDKSSQEGTNEDVVPVV